jgi:hypothetical protein
VHFIETLLQEHADALNSGRVTHLKFHLGRMISAS